MEDVEEKRRIPLKVLWTLGAGAAALLLLWLTGVLDRDARELQLAGQEGGAKTDTVKPDVFALRPAVHALRPAVLKLKPLIEKDTSRPSETDEE